MCCVSEVTPLILPLILMLILYPCALAALHSLLSILLDDPEIAHQWSENP